MRVNEQDVVQLMCSESFTYGALSRPCLYYFRHISATAARVRSIGMIVIHRQCTTVWIMPPVFGTVHQKLVHSKHRVRWSISTRRCNQFVLRSSVHADSSLTVTIEQHVHVYLNIAWVWWQAFCRTLSSTVSSFGMELLVLVTFKRGNVHVFGWECAVANIKQNNWMGSLHAPTK